MIFAHHSESCKLEARITAVDQLYSSVALYDKTKLTGRCHMLWMEMIVIKD